MKKQILRAFTLVVLAVALSACGESLRAPLATPQPATPTQAVSQPIQPPAATVDIPTATETPIIEKTPSAVSFLNDVKPILDTRCIKCHGVERKKEGLDLQTYENIFAGSRNGPVLEPGNAEDSLLVQLIVEREMPNRGDPVTPQELQLIIDWVNQGALNN
ncbi:MAG: c-type cytochrome domain-containing protein [Chloroflexota bacterium]